MSTVIETIPNPGSEFEALFGAPPGTNDPQAECAKWQQLCAQLLVDRAKLRAELEQARLEKIFAEWAKEPIPTWEEMQTMIDRTTSLEQIVEELERDAENEK